MSEGLFFLASKLFWLLARPESLLVLLVLGAVLFRRRWPAVLAAAAMLLIGATPISDWLLLPLERQYRADPDTNGAAGVIVLGGASQSGVMRAWDTLAINEHGERFLAASTQV